MLPQKRIRNRPSSSGASQLPAGRACHPRAPWRQSRHAVSCKELLELSEGAGATVADVVVAEIAESDRRLASGHCREIGRRIGGIAEDTVRLSGLQRGLPQILTVVVLQLADSSEGLVIQEEGSALAIGALEGVDEVDELIGGNGRGGFSRDTDIRTAGRREDARGWPVRCR